MTTPTNEAPANCPRCGSTSIQAVPVKRSDLGAAFAAEYFLGTAAGVAASSQTVIQAVCLKCGCQWLPGTVQEEQIRALAGQRGEAAKLAAQAAATKAQGASEFNNAMKIFAIVALGFLFVVILLTNS